MTCQFPGAATKQAQRALQKPRQTKSKAAEVYAARLAKRMARREPVFCCRFCMGMSWCREAEGCPLGPVGCGLPYAPERIR
jgi:hypothetical protein